MVARLVARQGRGALATAEAILGAGSCSWRLLVAEDGEDGLYDSDSSIKASQQPSNHLRTSYMSSNINKKITTQIA